MKAPARKNERERKWKQKNAQNKNTERIIKPIKKQTNGGTAGKRNEMISISTWGHCTRVTSHTRHVTPRRVTSSPSFWPPSIITSFRLSPRAHPPASPAAVPIHPATPHPHVPRAPFIYLLVMFVPGGHDLPLQTSALSSPQN